MCPVCWDDGVEKIEGVTLTASTLTDRPASGALVYRYNRWHIFAVFERIITAR